MARTQARPENAEDAQDGCGRGGECLETNIGKMPVAVARRG